jgi:putative ABC transport system permease protein
MSSLLRILSAIKIALRAVLRNKLRAALTIVGIMIGIAAVVTVWALGTSARESVGKQIAAIGSNALIVFPRSARSSGARTTGAGSKLSEFDCDALARESTSIRLVAPFLRATAQVIYEGQNAKPQVMGTRIPYFEVRSWKIARGEIWSAASENISEKVAVIGAQVARDLFGPVDPIGRTIRIGQHPYRVIGLLQEKGQSPFGSQDNVVLMPITTMRSHVLVTRPGKVDALMLSATSAETTARAKEQTEGILRQLHRIKPGEEDDFMVGSQAEFMKMQDSIFGVLTALLVGVAFVSLIVGGIGVMNIMLVSVTERTREIGIRMAIGAREEDILVQFLVEALVLATLGGIIGTLIGYGAIFGLSRAFDWQMRLEPVALIVALGTSTMIGLVFGFFPARRAARMEPVQALGRE